MKKLVSGFACTAFVILTAACGSATVDTGNSAAPTNSAANASVSPSPKPSASDEMATIRPVYTQKCEGCHGKDGKGGAVDIEGKKLKVPSFMEGHAMKHPDADFVKQINNGGGGMPAFKAVLKPEQIDGLVKFIRTEFQQGQAPAASPASK